MLIDRTDILLVMNQTLPSRQKYNEIPVRYFDQCISDLIISLLMQLILLHMFFNISGIMILKDNESHKTFYSANICLILVCNLMS